MATAASARVSNVESDRRLPWWYPGRLVRPTADTPHHYPSHAPHSYLISSLKTDVILCLGVTGRDTDSLQGSNSHPLARQGTVTAALRLTRDKVCDREEWTGEGKADSIKSQGQETQLGVIGTPRQGINTCQDAYDVIMTSPGLKPPVMS